jgi:nickel-type superoxide dismutase maturation protease
MLYLLKVTGSSLAPIFLEGDFVVVSKIPFLFHPLRVGDVIVFNHPVYQSLIKRVESIDPSSRKIFVLGDHSESIDSRSFGPIDASSVLGKVVWHIKKKRV